MSLVDPAPPLLALLTTVIVGGHVLAFAGFTWFVLRLLRDPREPEGGDDPGGGWGDDDQGWPAEPPRHPSRPRSRPVPRHRRRTAGTARRPRVSSSARP